jgi:hypothetical protein
MVSTTAFTTWDSHLPFRLYGTDRSEWFALYSADTADDWVFVNGVQRGNFRLHPKGPRNLSEGCITLADPAALGLSFPGPSPENAAKSPTPLQCRMDIGSPFNRKVQATGMRFPT